MLYLALVVPYSLRGIKKITKPYGTKLWASLSFHALGAMCVVRSVEQKKDPLQSCPCWCIGYRCINWLVVGCCYWKSNTSGQLLQQTYTHCRNAFLGLLIVHVLESSESLNFLNLSYVLLWNCLGAKPWAVVLAKVYSCSRVVKVSTMHWHDSYDGSCVVD